MQDYRARLPTYLPACKFKKQVGESVSAVLRLLTPFKILSQYLAVLEGT